MLSILYDIHVCRLDLLSSIVLEYMSESMNILFTWEYTREYDYIFCIGVRTRVNILLKWQYARECNYFVYMRGRTRVWIFGSSTFDLCKARSKLFGGILVVERLYLRLFLKCNYTKMRENGLSTENRHLWPLPNVINILKLRQKSPIKNCSPEKARSDKTIWLLFLFLRIFLVWYNVRFCIQIMVQVFDYIVIAYITFRTFTEINFKKTFIQGQVIGSS